MNHRKRDQKRRLRNKYNKNKLTKLYQEQLTKQHLQNQATTLNNDYYTSSTVVNEIRRQSRNVVSETNDENIGDDVSAIPIPTRKKITYYQMTCFAKMAMILVILSRHLFKV